VRRLDELEWRDEPEGKGELAREEQGGPRNRDKTQERTAPIKGNVSSERTVVVRREQDGE
jgi:hypothetical protein